MHNADPGLIVEMRVSTSRDVEADFDRGVLDAAIVLRHDDSRRDGDVLLEEAFGWMAAPNWNHHAGEPLRRGDVFLDIRSSRPRGIAHARHRVSCDSVGAYQASLSMPYSPSQYPTDSPSRATVLKPPSPSTITEYLPESG